MWKTPADWLNSLLREIEDIDVLRGYAITLAYATDSDTIQDLFEDEMDRDGYFDESDRYLCAESDLF